jgi:type IV pilus assembly protein PilP
MNRALKSYLLVLFLSLSLAACKGEESKPQVVSKKPARRVSMKPKSAAVKDVAGKKKPVVIAAIKRNPFKPYEFTKASEIFKPKTPLQRYSIGELRLSAVIWGIEQPAGMVETPDGKGYVVMRGDLIGDKNGRVMHIKKDGIVIVERYKDHSGKVRIKKSTINLPSSKERGEAR